MLSHRLITLIETHADSLTREVIADLLSNDHTPSLRRIPKAQMEPRILELFQHLGNWIGEPNDAAIRNEYETWGNIRRQEGIPISEIVFSLILTKKHLRQYIRDYAHVIFSGDPVTPGEFFPLELYSIQELNYVVGDFFDRALYYLARGYEKQVQTKRDAATA